MELYPPTNRGDAVVAVSRSLDLRQRAAAQAPTVAALDSDVELLRDVAGT